MPKTTKKTIVASIVQTTGVAPSKAKEALETVLDSITRALGEGEQVDIGKLGRLVVVKRPPRSRISKNLKYVSPTIDRLHQKHPKTVRLIKRQDLSERPQPTQVTKNVVGEEPIPAVSRRVAVAFPSWHRRLR
jgi:nucleoid DNA-binding protein